MSKFFLSSVKYDKMNENGVVKKVTEQYLLDAISYTEAEARTNDELTPFISGDFEIASIIKPRISELIDYQSDEGKFYKATAAFIRLDEKTGMEKLSKVNYLVRANDFDSALSKFKEFMKPTMSDWTLLSLVETAIVDFYPYKPQN